MQNLTRNIFTFCIQFVGSSLPLSLLLFFNNSYPVIASLSDEAEAKEIESNGSKTVAEGDYSTNKSIW
jgi:uncharacterized membrane protein